MKIRNLVALCIATIAFVACGSDGVKQQPQPSSWVASDFELIPYGYEWWDCGEADYFEGFYNTSTKSLSFDCVPKTLFHDGMAIIADGDDFEQLNYINKQGKRLLDEPCQSATIFSEGLAWIAKSGSPLTIIRRDGSVVAEMKGAEGAYAFLDGVAVFYDGKGLHGVADKSGKVLIEPRYEEAYPFVANNHWVVLAGDCWVIVDITTKEEVFIDGTPRFTPRMLLDGSGFSSVAHMLRNDRLVVRENDLCGVMKTDGEWAIKPQFYSVAPDGNNYLFNNNGVFGWCSGDGEYKINPTFRDAYPFCGANITPVCDNDTNRWGYINHDGDWVIEPQFRYAQPFSESGIAIARDGGSGKWGIINREGKWKVNPMYNDIYFIGSEDVFIAHKSYYDNYLMDAKGEFLYGECSMFSKYVDMLRSNAVGQPEYVKATSDYVDIEAYAAAIETELLAIKRTTTGEALTQYSINDSRFPKSGGSAKLYERNPIHELTLSLNTKSLNTWSKESDGWYGYNYTFIPTTVIDSYTFTASFSSWSRSQRAWRYKDAIIDILKQKYGFNAENNSLTVPGLKSVVISRNGSSYITFTIDVE